MNNNPLLYAVDTVCAAVAEFHESVRVSPMHPLHKGTTQTDVLQSVGEKLIELSQEFDIEDPIGNRAHLIVEEVGELMLALAESDPVKVLDALADSSYVLHGTAVTLDLPLAAGFVEVHASNMTKERQPDDPEAARVRSKGPNYVPPNLDAVYERHLTGRFSPHTIDVAKCECKWCGISLTELYDALNKGDFIPVCHGGND